MMCAGWAVMALAVVVLWAVAIAATLALLPAPYERRRRPSDHD